ncbi:AMP-binding protein [Aquabacterium sp. A7-Y]|uniref:condensation domain-containing protein n=1 Tax=Aquabacterium sp. A7-Y TaxID=1349605 RepID=UPI00223E304A|nr:condensation domain-containing protein [Aquabacterium sp. A7-Y]MCW7539369.1 AMP-binding protein [Aquabacterium sp. A7-Y]
MFDLRSTPADLVSALRRRALLHPERTAIDFLGDGEHVTESLSYGELDRRVRALAQVLQDAAAPGERALLLFPSGLDYAAAFFACLYAGLVGVPLYPPETGQAQAVKRLLSVAQDARPALALTDVAGLEALTQHELHHPGMRVVVTPACCGDAEAWRERRVEPDDLAFLQYTSGSTASPKGVRVSHRHLLANHVAMAEGLQEGPEERYLSWLPLFHDMGLIFGLLQPLLCGRPLVLMSPKRFIERPRRWLEAVSRYRITMSGGPDFAYRLCADRVRPATVTGLDLSCWRIAFCGAEPVRHSTFEAFRRLAEPLGFSARSFCPCYGLAEATLFVSAGPDTGMKATVFDTAALARGVAEPAAQGTTLVACGTTVDGTEVHIVEPDSGRLLPEDQVGELWVRGPTVAGGYWGQELATRATFAARDSEGRDNWLRTGDLGFVHGGQLYLSSRLKDLVILRGRNFYPQDIELEIESRVAGVRPGRVAVFAAELADSETIAVAAETARLRPGEGDHASVIESIRQAVAEAFGEPVGAVALLKPGTLPKTSSGKLRRSACRDGWHTQTLETFAVYRADLGAAAHAPAALGTDTERRLASLWGELLDLDQVMVHDNFFALGGQSLLMTQLAARLRTDFGVALPLASCFTAATLGELARRIDEAPRIPATTGLQARPGETQDRTLPLSYAQRRLWFLQSLEPDSAFYHVAVGLAFSAPVDPARLQAALDTLVRRHEALRTVLVDEAEGPRQKVLAAMAVPLMQRKGGDERVRQQQVNAVLSVPFDLARGPLLRALLLDADGHEPKLVLAMHHIAVDGAALKPLLAELALSYAGAELPPVPLQYGDFALWQQAELAPRLPALIEAWQAQLLDAPVLTTLTPDQPRPPEQSHRGACLRLQLPVSLLEALEQWARGERATLFMALFAAYAATLAEASGQTDLVIGTDIANRHEPGSEGIVGFFVNQLPVRCRVPAAPGPGPWLTGVRDTLLAAYALQDLPFDQLVEAVRPPRSLAHAPVFQTKFVFQDAPPVHQLAPGLSMTPFDIPRETAELDLLFDLSREARGVAVRIEYATDLYRPDTVARFASRFVARLEAWAAKTELPQPARKALVRRAARAVDPTEQTR